MRICIAMAAIYTIKNREGIIWLMLVADAIS
jgi:hypothetical protein